MKKDESIEFIKKKWSCCLPFESDDKTIYMISDPNLYRLKKLNTIEKIEIKPIKTTHTKILFEIDNLLNNIWIDYELFSFVSVTYDMSFSDIKSTFKNVLINNMDISIMCDKDFDEDFFSKLKYI